eukprot:165566-Chlamydomonas_euryale.AAC.1
MVEFGCSRGWRCQVHTRKQDIPQPPPPLYVPWYGDPYMRTRAPPPAVGPETNVSASGPHRVASRPMFRPQDPIVWPDAPAVRLQYRMVQHSTNDQYGAPRACVNECE